MYVSMCQLTLLIPPLVLDELMFFYILVPVDNACSYLKEINKCIHGTCEITAGNNYPKCM